MIEGSRWLRKRGGRKGGEQRGVARNEDGDDGDDDDDDDDDDDADEVLVVVVVVGGWWLVVASGWGKCERVEKRGNGGTEEWIDRIDRGESLRRTCASAILRTSAF
jgi:hypothetical protein